MDGRSRTWQDTWEGRRGEEEEEQEEEKKEKTKTRTIVPPRTITLPCSITTKSIIRT
jgi:hypothetical protein